jgi:hypothetical protein
MTSHTDDFDWVSAQAACTATQMFQRLLDGARKDVERRATPISGQPDDLRFELHSDSPDHFEIARSGSTAHASAFVTFERSGPRIAISGDGVDVEMTVVIGINPAGECRYYVGEVEYLGWEIRKLALDLLFFEPHEEE